MQPAAPPAAVAAPLPAEPSERARRLRLGALRRSVLLLHAKLDELHRRLSLGVPSSSAWPEALAAFSLAGALLSSACGELRAEAQGSALLYPSAPHLGGATAWWREAALPAMLSSRLEPEQEAEEAAHAHALGAGGGQGVEAAAALAALHAQAERHNAGLRDALAVVARRRGELQRPAGREAAAAGAPAPPPPADVARLLAAAQWGEGLRLRR